MNQIISLKVAIAYTVFAYATLKKSANRDCIDYQSFIVYIKIIIKLILNKYFWYGEECNMKEEQGNIKVIYGKENLKEILTEMIEKAFIEKLKNN